MEKIKLVEKKVRFSSIEQLVKLQFILYCFTKEIHLTTGDYNLLTHIALHGYDRKNTPTDLVEKGVFQHRQSVRNTRNKMVKQGFLIRERSDYVISPELEIESSGALVIDFKAAYL